MKTSRPRSASGVMVFRPNAHFCSFPSGDNHMIPARDALWNIPEWAHLFMYFSQALAAAILIAKLYQRGRLWLKGQGQVRLDHFWQRVWRVILYGFGQVRIAREKFAGTMHLSFFWAFVFLFIGTVLALIDYDLGELILKRDNLILKGNFYLVYEAILDLFTLIGIVGLTLALIRRVGLRPNKLTYDFGFTFMLGLFWVLFVNGLLIEAVRLTVAPPEWATWSFAGFGVSRLLAGIPHPILESWHVGLWVFHVFTVFVFWAAFLDMPTRHILLSPLNVFFSSFRHAGALAPLNLEDERIEAFGVGEIHQLGIFQLLDGDACTECGRCQAACPAHMAGTPLNPKQVILDIRAGLDRYESDLIKLDQSTSDVPPMPITREIVSIEALGACTTCRACVYECPVLIEHVDSIVDMRRYLTLMEADIPDLLTNAMTQAERAGNPWGNPRGSRMNWAQGLNVPLMADKKNADVLYWVGCAGAYDPESQKTARAMVRIFEAAGIDYAVLGEEERCNCEWARRAGNEFLFQQATHSNIAIFDKYEFKAIVTHCPHCFNTFANEYPQFGGQYDVEHHSTYIAGLISKGYLKPGKTLNELTTYHDSCYLGRYNDVYDDPRDALRATGLNLVEMQRSRAKGLCCGGGGAQVWMETHQENPVNIIRLEEAMSTGAKTIGTACPFCTIMLSSAAQSKGVTGEVAVRDVAVIVAEAL